MIGTFAPDGAETCSGLAVARDDADALADAVGAAFAPLERVRHEHVTPAGRVQPFTFVRFCRR